MEVVLDERRIPVRSFVAMLLARRVRFRPTVTAPSERRYEIVLRDLVCAECGTRGLVHFAFEEPSEDVATSTCGRPVHADRLPVRPFDPDVLARVAASLSSRPDLPPAFVVRERDLPGFGRRPSFGCPKCDLVVRAGLREGEDSDVREQPELALARLEVREPAVIAVERLPHWCISETGRFCVDHT